jgi:cobalt-zinc-cadmium efflux system outer membrane protein
LSPPRPSAEQSEPIRVRISDGPSQTGIVRTAYADPTEPPRDIAPAPLPDGIAPTPLSEGRTASPAGEPSPEGPLTLQQVEALALARNPSLHQAGAVVQMGAGNRRQVGRYPNPMLAYQGQEIGDDGTAGQQGIMLQQTIVLGRKLELNELVADWDVQVLHWQAEAQRYRVRNDVRRQFFIALGAQQRVSIAQELHRIAQEGVKTTRTLQEALIAARPDVLQAEIQLQEVDVILRNAYYQRDASWKQLASVMGMPDMPLVELANQLEVSDGPRELETARQQLLALSPQLHSARAEVQRAAARIRREEVQPIPNLQVQVGAMYMFASQDPGANVQLGLPLPVFNRNDGNISRAMADYQRACWNVQRLELALESQLAASFQAYQDAANRVRVYRDEIVPRQTETLRLIESAYPEQFDFLRVLTARMSYFQARLLYLQALVDLRTAEVALDGLLLSGGLDDPTLAPMDSSLRDSAIGGM